MHKKFPIRLCNRINSNVIRTRTLKRIPKIRLMYFSSPLRCVQCCGAATETDLSGDIQVRQRYKAPSYITHYFYN